MVVAYPRPEIRNGQRPERTKSHRIGHRPIKRPPNNTPAQHNALKGQNLL